jgi:hypothetical protein
MGAALGEQAQGGFQDAVADLHLVILPNGAQARYRRRLSFYALGTMGEVVPQRLYGPPTPERPAWRIGI